MGFELFVAFFVLEMGLGGCECAEVLNILGLWTWRFRICCLVEGMEFKGSCCCICFLT